MSSVDADEVRALAEAAGTSPVVARVLLERGVRDTEAARRFLSPDLERDWTDPEALPGMGECADAVADALRKGERLLVFGDFDVDGLTATALTVRGLRELGGDVDAVVPHRFKDGYGLTPAAVERVLAARPALVVTVDCGISDGEGVRRLVEAGIRVVVTDHHVAAGDVPTGVPVCDPKLRLGDEDEPAGATVALKLVAAVGARLGRADAWRDLVDLAAIGTVGDVMPLLGENRALVAEGMSRIRREPRPWIAALCEAAAVDASRMRAEHVSFWIAPRLNAAGRIADPREALDLLLADDPATCRELARALDGYNRVRQAAEADLAEEAEARARDAWRGGERVLVLAGEGWHEGVRGIVASRIAGRYGVPSLLFCIEDGEARGSGRSVGAVDLHAAVASCSDLLTRFGGHAGAVGVTLPAERLEEFAARLRDALASVPREAFRAAVRVDAEIALGQATRGLAGELAALEPFGAGNPRPLLASRGVFMNGRRRVGRRADHLSFEAYDGIASVRAIAFRCPGIERLSEHETAVDLCYSLETDTWKGRERVQLNVRDVVAHEELPGAAVLVDELFADAERILARGAYEGIGDAESFHTKLAGVTFEGRQEAVARLSEGTALRVVCQPDNPFDPNAVALFDATGDQVGFFNRALAAALAPEMDAGAVYEVSVTDVTGREARDEGAARSLGVNVLVERAGAGPREAEDEGSRRARRAELEALPPAGLDAALVRALIGDGRLHAAQEQALQHLAAGRSCLTVMATGRGKSLIFQMHAARLALARREASVFVYPLRALVADQAFHLDETFGSLGLSATLLTGETPLAQRDAVFASLADGAVDALLTTPEFLERHAARFAESGRVRFVVVDEAHHVGLARAGHRPAYLRLGDALETLGRPLVCAVTATASDDVAAVIRGALGIEAVVADPTRRDNLRVSDRRGLGDRVAHLSSLAVSGEKTIVYVNSRERSVRIAQHLRAASPRLSHRTAFYNGGMSRAARHAVERAFRDGELSVIVATSAFGEGVDIPDVRHVALVHLPFNRVEFNQMCGRAGRDGRSATIEVLFGERDSRVNEMVLAAAAPDLDDLRALYAVLRERVSSAADGWVEVTNADLAEAVKARRRRARLTERGVSAGIGVFREMGLVTGEGTGSYRRLALVPVGEKVDLTSSVRYREGLEEAEEFGEFREWVLGASADELLAAIDRPILPSA